MLAWPAASPPADVSKISFVSQHVRKAVGARDPSRICLSLR